jgi:hypothetical protein
MLPYSRVNLNGSASYDPDGIIFLYNWRKLTGPAGPVLLNSGSAIAKVIDLVEGTYSFELSVKDNLGALSKDTVNVNVVNNMRTAELFQLNPNPATNQIRVLYQMDALSNGKLSVYDQSGYLRMSYPFQSNPGLFQKEIVISSLQPGMYYLEIYINNQKRIIRKFIKQ